ncbi:MAG: aspartate/glutamate racemase family protein [Chloroflexi bacterium]|nr:aspartate/glutamate racemase family protein [Chloroflexota bacterium]
MAVIGIVGGIGPYAGLDLARKIFDQTQADTDQEHLPVALLSLSHRIPDRTEFLLGLIEENPAFAISQVIWELHRCGASVVGIACNTAHAAPIFGEIVKQSPPAIKLVHMIDEVGRYIQEKYPACQTVGILSTTGTWQAHVYPDALASYDFDVVQVEKDIQEKYIHPAIYAKNYGIKARSNPVTDRARKNLEVGIAQLKEKGAEAIILGCTEIPLAFPEESYQGTPLLDATRILARALILAFAPEKLAT